MLSANAIENVARQSKFNSHKHLFYNLNIILYETHLIFRSIQCLGVTIVLCSLSKQAAQTTGKTTMKTISAEQRIATFVTIVMIMAFGGRFLASLLLSAFPMVVIKSE